MNVDEMLRALNQKQVDYLLIGGMNFLLRHLPELTFDVDIWVRDDADNLEHVNSALEKLHAEWGRTESEWKQVAPDWHWLQSQAVFCLTTAHGALDVFREVRGLEGRYLECKARGVRSETANGIPFTGLSDLDMLACQEALPTASPPNAGVPRGHQPRGGERIAVNLEDLKQREERKREAAYDPVKRWQHIQQTITWAEANLPLHLRRNRPRTRAPLSDSPNSLIHRFFD